MTAIHAKNTGVVVNSDDLSRFFKNVDISGEAELIEITTFTATAKQWLIGYTDAKLSLDGYFGSKDPATPGDPNEVDDVLQPLLGDQDATQLMLICPESMDTFGNNASFCDAEGTKYSVTSPFNNAVSVMAEAQASGGVNVGVLLAEKIARTVTGQSAAYDLGAATTNGFAAQLHAFTVGATTSVTVTIEDSADGTTGWAQIGAFTAAAVAASQRIVITGNVRRFVRAKWTFTGSNGATFVVAFALLPR